MKKYLFLLLLSLAALPQFTVAQGRKGALRQEMMSRVRAAKWAFIVYRLQLDERRAERLRPVYEAYESEKRSIYRGAARRVLQGNEEMTDEQAEALMNIRLENAKKILALKEKYKTEFLKILSPSELLALQNAEQDFLLKIQAERQKRRAGRR